MEEEESIQKIIERSSEKIIRELKMVQNFLYKILNNLEKLNKKIKG